MFAHMYPFQRVGEELYYCHSCRTDGAGKRKRNPLYQKQHTNTWMQTHITLRQSPPAIYSFTDVHSLPPEKLRTMWSRHVICRRLIHVARVWVSPSYVPNTPISSLSHYHEEERFDQFNKFKITRFFIIHSRYELPCAFSRGMFSQNAKSARNADPITLACLRVCFHGTRKPLLGTLARSLCFFWSCFPRKQKPLLGTLTWST